MAKKAKLPKKIAGVRIPKAVRKGPVAEFLHSPGGQVAIAEALVIAAGVFAARRDPDAATAALRNPGESLKEFGRSTVKAKESVSRGSRKLSHAFTEAIKSFRSALQDPDVAATLADDGELLNDSSDAAIENAAKKKWTSAAETKPEVRYPSSGTSL